MSKLPPGARLERGSSAAPRRSSLKRHGASRLMPVLFFPKAKDDMVREPTKDLFDAGAFLAKVGT